LHEDETEQIDRNRYAIKAKAWSEFAILGTATATAAVLQQHAAEN
jgi:hypothetical protein